MKRVLSLVLALVLVLGMIPTFAADMTGGQHLYEHEFIAGDGMGNLNEADMLTREQLAKLILELNGSKEEAEALTLPPSFTDSAKISAWARPYVAYAQIEGLMVGFSDGSFRPQEGVTGQQLAAVLTRALGYEFEWATVIADAADLGIEVAAVAKLTRGEAFEAMWVTVNTVPEGETLPLGVILGKIEDTTPPPVGPLAVTSATAINTKQVEVVFNQAVDKTTAGNEANYTFGGAAAGKAVVQEDGMTVLVTMAGETKITNAGTIAFKVLKAVKDANGVALAADYSVTALAAVDTTVPSVTSIEAVGAKTLKITFSEPVYDAAGNTALENDQITVKSGIYTYVVTSAVADYAARTITVTVGTNLIEGDLTVKINAPGMSDAEAIRDFAGLVLIPVEKTYAFVKDTTVATATLTSVNKATKTAKVTFSKPVYGSTVKLYHSVNGEAAYATAAVTKAENAAATEWSFVFTNALPSGTLTFYLVNDTVAANQLTDLYGVKVPNQTFTYTVVADTTAPTVSKLTVNTNASIDIDFSEDVAAAEVVAANFEILKPDGKALSFTPSVVDADTVRLTATFVDNTVYTVTVKAMKDVAGNAMAAAYTATATIGDNQNPTLDEAYFTDASTLYLVFSENMNQTDLANKANYVIDGNALVAADTVTVVSGTKVKITINAAGLSATDAVVVGAVKDLAGKKLTSDAAFSTTFAGGMTADELDYSAQLIAVNKVKIIFTKELSLFNAADFAVAGANLLAIESNSVNTDGVSEVVVVLDTDLAANGTPAVTTVAGPTTKSTEGTVVNALENHNAADKVAPTIKHIALNGTTQIIVTFSEALESDLFAVSGNNGFSVTGGTLTSALLATDGTQVTLTGTSFTNATDVAYNGTNGIKDLAANTLAAFTYTSNAAVLTATDAATPDDTATLAVADYTETYTAGALADILSDADNTIVAGEFKFVASGTALAGAADDNLIITVAANGGLTFAFTDTTLDTGAVVATITITHIPTGAVDTLTVTIAAGDAEVVTE